MMGELWRDFNCICCYTVLRDPLLTREIACQLLACDLAFPIKRTNENFRNPFLSHSIPQR
jgi:hypothetical protein